MPRDDTQCRDDDIVVIGAGNSAGQAAMHLADSGARVEMLVRGERLGASTSSYLLKRIEHHPLIATRMRSRLTGLHAGGGALEALTVADAEGSEDRLSARALFICGGQPRTGWADEAGVSSDGRGYLLTGPDLLQGAAARRAGRSTATRSCSRRAFPGSSPRVMSATARPSAWEAPWARARWRLPSPTCG